VVNCCECGNEPPSSIKCGECSLFPSWSGQGLISTPGRMLFLYHERQLSYLNTGTRFDPRGLSLSGFAPSASVFSRQRHSAVLHTYISFNSHRRYIIVVKLTALLNNTHTPNYYFDGYFLLKQAGWFLSCSLRAVLG